MIVISSMKNISLNKGVLMGVEVVVFVCFHFRVNLQVWTLILKNVFEI